MTNEDVVRRLHMVIAVLKLAHREEIADARAEIRADDVDGAILDTTDDWVGSTALQQRVSRKTGKSARTVRDHLPVRVARGVLEQGGSEGATGAYLMGNTEELLRKT